MMTLAPDNVRRLQGGTGTLDQQSLRTYIPRDSAAIIILLTLVSATILLVGRHDYPNLHVMLDSSTCLMSSVLALLLADIGLRLKKPFPICLAASLAVTSSLEFIHIMASIEWWGVLSPITGLHDRLRPVTWPPAAYILPIGVGGSIFLCLKDRAPVRLFITFLVLVTVCIVVIFVQLPPYTAPTWLGITRPSLTAVPLLWLAVGYATWRWRDTERKMRPLTVMAGVLASGCVVMLYSTAPHDGPAMVAHLSKVAAYLILLRALMQMGSSDALNLARAERALENVNQSLQVRIAHRTEDLERANRSLMVEVDTRRAAEEKADARLERLNLLNQIARAISERQDLGSILQIAVANIERHLPADFCCLCRHDETTGQVNVTNVGTNSLPTAINMGMAPPAPVTIDDSLLACLRGSALYEPELTNSDFPLAKLMTVQHLQSVMILPLQIESTHFGILIVARKGAVGFAELERDFLQQLCEHIALAAHQARLYSALQEAYDELRQTQEAILQQERLRALGQMASGIAHDINNALTPASLYTDALLEDRALDSSHRSILEIIRRAIEDVAHTVARMREFYRPREQQMSLLPVSINDAVRHVVDLTRARWKDMTARRGISILISPDLAPDLPPILGAESEIREALVNLVLNAVDALPDGGQIGIKTWLASDGAEANSRICVEVSDTGVGMDDVTRSRCLEPFFTTKGDRGTGLGLAMVYGVVQRHGANLEIDSTLGRGTTFRLQFPVAHRASPLPTQVHQHQHQRRLRVLVVDDDPVLLRTLRDILEIDGHSVQTAIGGQAGIDAFIAHRDTDSAFAAVITDLGMPTVDGRKVATSIKHNSPSTSVIMLTGWGDRLVAEGDIPDDVDLLLSKPPKLQDIRDALLKVASASGA